MEDSHNSALITATIPHVDSFDAFLSHYTPAVISCLHHQHVEAVHDTHCPAATIRAIALDIGYPTTQKDTSVGRKRLPRECRECRETYDAHVQGTFDVNCGEYPATVITRSLGNLPIMVRSLRCVPIICVRHVSIVLVLLLKVSFASLEHESS